MCFHVKSAAQAYTDRAVVFAGANTTAPTASPINCAAAAGLTAQPYANDAVAHSLVAS